MLPLYALRSTSALAALVLLLAACATTPAGAPSRADASAVDPQAPARDLDLFPKQIPPLLVDALHYPYQAPQPLDCPTLAARVRELDAVLGADLDDPRRPPRSDRTAQRLLVSGVKSAIPYFGWLRRLTGADQRQRQAQAAFVAGYARRGYLKGLGDRRGCPPPAAPYPEVAEPGTHPATPRR